MTQSPITPDADAQDTAFIVHPEVKARRDTLRNADDMIEEIQGLAEAIELEILGTSHIKVSEIQPATFIGKGQTENIRLEVERLKPSVVIVNTSLSPMQQRNLEKIWKKKVIDRTGLIIEIFGARAQTKEGSLQVDLAMLEYQRTRLTHAWTHLERQRATGKVGGPGETQSELDKRRIDERIKTLKRELEDVRRTRNLSRAGRERVPLPVISVVGYTNAGKSTLFNTLTGADVFAKDLLFATLDPTLRRIELPNGQAVILADTVGFISDLPTHLIAAFRATLEQAVHADVILHVIDVSRHDWQAQREDVIEILSDLGIEYEQDGRIFELYNKADLLDEDAREDLTRKAKFSTNAAMISALRGEGIETFIEKITGLLSSARLNVRLRVPFADGKALSWLYEHTEILSREDGEEGVTLDVMIEPADLDRFTQRHGYKPLEGKNNGRD